MSVNIGNIQKLTSPHPFALVSSLKENGETNLMAISWWSYASNHPASLVICLSKKGYTHELIEKNGEFALNIVGDCVKGAAFQCGTCSGRTVDKASQFHIELKPSALIRPMLVRDSRVSLECRVAGQLTIGDHVLFSATIEEAHINEHLAHLYAFDGYARLGVID